MTPVHEKIRFDTFFFVCILPQMPAPTDVHINPDEIESLEVIGISK